MGFSVKAGEIVGLTGIIGSGREALVDSIYGIRRIRRGTVEVDGSPVKLRSPVQAIRSGLVLVPRDRRNDGLVLDMSVGDNVNVATLDAVSSKLGWLLRGQARDRSDQLVEQLDVRPRRSDTIVRFLSGGNQQKVVLAKWLATSSKVFVLGPAHHRRRCRRPQRDLLADRPTGRRRSRGDRLIKTTWPRSSASAIGCLSWYGAASWQNDPPPA